jgi:hypothetical protein
MERINREGKWAKRENLWEGKRGGKGRRKEGKRKTAIKEALVL